MMNLTIMDTATTDMSNIILGINAFNVIWNLIYILALLFAVFNLSMWIIGLVKRRDLFNSLLMDPALMDMNRYSGFVVIESCPERIHLSSVRYMPLPSKLQKVWVFISFNMGAILLSFCILLAFIIFALDGYTSPLVKTSIFSSAFLSQGELFIVYMIVPISALAIFPSIYVNWFYTDRHPEIRAIINELSKMEIKAQTDLVAVRIRFHNAQEMVNSYRSQEFQDAELINKESFIDLASANYDKELKALGACIQRKRIIPLLIKILADNLMNTGSNPYKSEYTNAIESFRNPNMYRAQYLLETMIRRGHMKDASHIINNGENTPEIEGKANDLKALIALVQELKLSKFWR